MSLGALGERAAQRFLERQGYIIRHRNWRCKIGELDLVAQQGHCLVFIEVKTRRAEIAADFTPEEAVDERKARKLEVLCRAYWQEFKPDIRYRRLRLRRIDIIAVEVFSFPKVLRLRHLQDALPLPRI